MYGSIDHIHSSSLEKRSRFALSSVAFAGAAFAIELMTIVALAILTGLGYHLVAYGERGPVDSYAVVGCLTGLTYGLCFLVRDEYGVESLLEGQRTNSRLFLFWSMAFAALAVIGFLTKSTAIVSRGWIVLFYVSGFVGAIALNAGLERGLSALMARGFMRRRKMLVVGTDRDCERLVREITDGAAGVYVAQRVTIPVDELAVADIDAALDVAVNNARAIGIEDVLISNELSGHDILERVIGAFNLLPVAIHLGTGGIVSKFKEARVARFGRATTLSLTREPLGPFEALSKRVFDIICAALAVVLVAPLFLLIATLIKLDSRGPVFFRQRRRGFNLEEFGIWKFRTMTTLEDGDHVKQATTGDVRVTAIGRILRKYSLDELPQLFNVLGGEMSLVGPRPHAVAHDRFYERRIALYPRRLNMKPGMTGWAQVNGFRGATDTDDAMRQRVEHDLYYIDNWSVSLDVYILLLTVLSPKARSNAF